MVRQRDGALREGLVMGVVLSMRRGSVLKWQFVGAQWDRLGILSSQLEELEE